MKIAIVSMIRSPWGGSEELWAAMAREALQAGHPVYLSALDTGQVHPTLQALADKGLSVAYRKKALPPGTAALKRLAILGYYFVRRRVRGAFREIFRHQPDVVIYNGTCYSIAADSDLLAALDKQPTRFFILAHYNPDNYRPISDAEAAVINQAYALAEKVFFVSQRNLDTARRHLANPIANAVLIRNPVNLQQLDAPPFPTGDTMQMALVGNLVTVHKGQDLLLEVLSRADWQTRDWRLNIYGDGLDTDYLKTLVHFYGLEQRVTFHGRVSDLRQVWAQNHILLMPSLMEGMPLAVVEAMLCGRTAVVTDVGGHAEWITDGVEGFIASAASVNSLAITLDRAWRAKDRWAAMGAAAHARALRQYDPRPGATLLNQLSTNHKA